MKIVGDHPWVGHRFYREKFRILLLGESYTGDWSHRPDEEHDDYWVPRAIDGSLPDLFLEQTCHKMGWKMSELHRFMFTNMVMGSLGPTNKSRPTPDQLRAGEPRLENLIRKYEVQGVFSLGKNQANPYARRVCSRLEIPLVAVNHPSGMNNAMAAHCHCTPEHIQAGWNELHAHFK